MSPAAGRVDRAQLRVIVRLSLGESWRRGVSPLTGARTNPLLQVVVSMSIMGLALALNALARPDETFFFRLVFGSAFVLVLFGLSPDQAAVRDRRREIFGSRPVSGATWLMARVVHLAVAGLVLTASFAWPALLAARFVMGVPPAVVAAAAALVLLQGAVAGVLWLSLAGFESRFLSLSAIRRLNTLVVVALALAMSMASMASLGRLPLPRAGELGRQALEWVPATWFGSLLVHDADPATWAQRAGAALLVAFAGGTLMGDLESRHRRYEEALQRAGEADGARAIGRAPLSLLVLRATSRLMRPAARAVAEAVLLHDARDEHVRMRRTSQAALAVVFVAMGLAVHPAQGFTTWMLVYLSASALLDAADSARHSPEPQASWPFWSSPLGARDAVRGMIAACMAHAVVMPGALAAIAVAQGQPPLAAVAGVAALFAALRLAAALVIALRPAMPLSCGERAFPVLASLGMAVALALALRAGLATVTLLASRGPVPAVLMLVACAMLLALSSGVERLAARRLAGVEAP